MAWRIIFRDIWRGVNGKQMLGLSMDIGIRDFELFLSRFLYSL